MEYLANHFTKVYESPSPESIFTYTPGICVLPGGRLLATMDLGGPGVAEMEEAFPAENGVFLGKVFTSDDGGASWQCKGNFPFQHARPFLAGERIYILGQAGDLYIILSLIHISLRCCNTKKVRLHG